MSDKPPSTSPPYVPASDDEMLDVAQCMAWLGIQSRRTFMDKVRAGRIPWVRALGRKNKRFHVRTVKVKLKMELKP